MIKHALSYVEKLHWAIFPVHAIRDGSCTCNNPKCQSPGKHPITRHGLSDASMDPNQIKQWWSVFPTANIGLATGSISGVWVLDIDPRHGGNDSLDLLEQANGILQAGVESLTGGGGKHLFYKYPQNGVIRSRANVLGPGLDIRGEGGFVVIPPSNHISGNSYEWEASSDPLTAEIDYAPGWLQAMVVEEKQAKPSAPPPAERQKATAGSRNVHLTRLAGKMRRSGFDMKSIEAALLAQNQIDCIPPLSDAEVIKIAKSVARYDPPHVPTDDELAELWLERHPNTAYGLGDFRRYKEGYWPVLPKHQAEAEILKIMEAAKKDGFKPTAWKLRSILEIAQIKSSIDNEVWNADKDLLVCKNGTLHIPTMALMPHDKNHYLTSGVAYDYDLQAHSPTWDYFCRSTLGELEEFLQEFSGYALTIDTSHELAVWLYGKPGSGKSTFIAGLVAMLGNRAGVLGLSDLEKSRFSLTDLPDKTLLVSTEQPSMYVQATEKINALISGEPIQMDRKFRDPVLVQSRAKICWAMNDLPRVGEANNGLFRRVKVVEFAEIPAPMINPSVKLKILDEGSGILNWALEGLRRLMSNGGFTVPQEVIDATSLFQNTNDIPAVFVDDWCETGVQYSIGSNSLYQAYRRWCEENGHRPQSSTSLAVEWRRLGFTRTRNNSGYIWHGVRVK